MIIYNAWNLTMLQDQPLVTAQANWTGSSVEVARQAVATMTECDADVDRLNSELWHLVVPIEQTVTPELIARDRTILEALKRD